MYIYVHIYIHIHAHTYTYTNTNIYICINIYRYNLVTTGQQLNVGDHSSDQQCRINNGNNLCMLYLKTVSAELQSQIKILTKTKSHMYIHVTS
jgi:hypothetical protein